jgi:hypothetical protein
LLTKSSRTINTRAHVTVQSQAKNRPSASIFSLSLLSLGLLPLHLSLLCPSAAAAPAPESPSLVLVINDTKLLMPCVKCFELGISNTGDEGVCGKEWWPQDHKEMVHEHEMMIMVEMHIK